MGLLLLPLGLSAAATFGVAARTGPTQVDTGTPRVVLATTASANPAADTRRPETRLTVKRGSPLLVANNTARAAVLHSVLLRRPHQWLTNDEPAHAGGLNHAGLPGQPTRAPPLSPA